jgi:hypothetical protein
MTEKLWSQLGITPVSDGAEGMCLYCGDVEGEFHVPQLGESPIICGPCFLRELGIAGKSSPGGPSAEKLAGIVRVGLGKEDHISRNALAELVERAARPEEPKPERREG